MSQQQYEGIHWHLRRRPRRIPEHHPVDLLLKYKLDFANADDSIIAAICVWTDDVRRAVVVIEQARIDPAEFDRTILSFIDPWKGEWFLGKTAPWPVPTL
jgi:hypothetical protein